MVADVLSNKIHNWIVTELFIRCRKLSISLTLVTECCFAAPKIVRLNSSKQLLYYEY